MKYGNMKGQSLVETTFVLLALLSLLLAMMAAAERLFVNQTLAQRVHDAARWGALNRYDMASVRNLVLYGETVPNHDAAALDGLGPNQVVVANPGCPGPDCRIVVAIPNRGVRSIEPCEQADLNDEVAAKR